ncbi:hypothetical protein TNCV_3324241 [Trichonephila clavipes]|nr:hypothetical protein TNCV_3324241 [Trichonephila clavipes]
MLIEAQWLSGSGSSFYTTGPWFKPRAGQDRLSLSSLQWVNKCVPNLLRSLTLGGTRQIDHLTGTCAHEPQDPRLRTLRWAHTFTCERERRRLHTSVADIIAPVVHNNLKQTEAQYCFSFSEWKELERYLALFVSRKSLLHTELFRIEKNPEVSLNRTTRQVASP